MSCILFISFSFLRRHHQTKGDNIIYYTENIINSSISTRSCLWFDLIITIKYKDMVYVLFECGVGGVNDMIKHNRKLVKV